MAQTTRETTGAEANYGTGYGLGEMATSWMPIAKDLFGLQFRTAQSLMDQSVKLTQTFADFYQTQAAEGLKLTQACVATGKGVAEELRRTATTVAEKVVTKN